MNNLHFGKIIYLTPSLQIKGVEIPATIQVNYLEISIEKRLTWCPPGAVQTKNSQ